MAFFHSFSKILYHIIDRFRLVELKFHFTFEMIRREQKHTDETHNTEWKASPIVMNKQS